MFRLVQKYEEDKKPLKIIKDLDVFDDVWVKDENEIYIFDFFAIVWMSRLFF